MANLFNKIFTGTLAQYTSALKEANALYMVYDGTTGVKSMYKGKTKVSGDFIIVNGDAPARPEQGVIYYISAFVKDGAATGKPFVGFHDGSKWVALSDSATIDALEERITDLEESVNGKGEGEEHVPGLLDNVATLMGADTVEGSVKKTVKDAVEALDVTDAEVEGSVVVAVNEEDGKVSSVKKAVAVTKQETPTEGQQATYDVTIGTKSVGKIDIPFCDAVLANAVLADMNATVDEETGAVTAGDPKDADALVMVFKKGDGTYVGVKVNISTILVESEFKDGLVVSENGEVSVKLVANNDYLKFGTPEASGKNAPLVANVVTLADAKAAEGATAAVTGLADALDVKTVIEENEKVTAAALTDLNQRVGENEELTTTAKVVVPAINELKAAIENKNVDAEGEEGDSALVTASAEDNTVTVASTQKLKDAVTAAKSAVQTIAVATEGQEVTVSTKSAANGYTISVTKATYAAAEFNEDGSVKTNRVLSQSGLVDSAVLKDYIADEIAKNAVYWVSL